MPITDDQVATLRALLTGELEEYRRRFRQLDPEVAKNDFPVLVAAGFLEAVDRRFAEQDSQRADVIEFVGEVRARAADAGDDIDPHAAERLILHFLGAKGSIADLDDKTVLSLQMKLQAVLINAERMDQAQLDAFIEQVRKTANEMARLSDVGD